MAPLMKNLYWVGSSYLWDYDNEEPTEAFRTQTQHLLNGWLKVPFKIVDHKASVRPANVERRPFVGFHPIYTQVGILNGMGTKGCSLAPFFAKQFTDQICNAVPLMPDADISRFKNILSR